VCSARCGKGRDAKRKREGRASAKLSASVKLLDRAHHLELRHWALTGEQSLVSPTHAELLELWLHHTCRVCRNGAR
jgi:hypothetical protein